MKPATGSRRHAGDEEDDTAHNSVDQATALVRAAILSGKYVPGARLKISDLSRDFGFSAMPLREALRKLEGEGLVSIEPNRGATVRELDRRFIEDLYELNCELQLIAIRNGMKTLTMARLDALRELGDAYAKAVENGDREKALRLNGRLHTRIVEFGGNQEALRIFRHGWELISTFRRSFGYGSQRELGLVREHGILLDALGRQDLQLAEAIIRFQHAAAVEDLFGQLDEASDVFLRRRDPEMRPGFRIS